MARKSRKKRWVKMVRTCSQRRRCRLLKKIIGRYFVNFLLRVPFFFSFFLGLYGPDIVKENWSFGGKRWIESETFNNLVDLVIYCWIVLKTSKALQFFFFVV